MEQLKVLYKCDLCGNEGEDLSLLSADHKELGWIKVCGDCWKKLYEKNHMIAGSSGSSKSSCSPCSSCPGCR